MRVGLPTRRQPRRGVPSGTAALGARLPSWLGHASLFAGQSGLDEYIHHVSDQKAARASIGSRFVVQLASPDPARSLGCVFVGRGGPARHAHPSRARDGNATPGARQCRPTSPASKSSRPPTVHDSNTDLAGPRLPPRGVLRCCMLLLGRGLRGGPGSSACGQGAASGHSPDPRLPRRRSHDEHSAGQPHGNHAAASRTGPVAVSTRKDLHPGRYRQRPAGRPSVAARTHTQRWFARRRLTSGAAAGTHRLQLLAGLGRAGGSMPAPRRRPRRLPMLRAVPVVPVRCACPRSRPDPQRPP